MSNLQENRYTSKREYLIEKYIIQNNVSAKKPVGTNGLDHLALISSNLDKTIDFYVNVLGMKLVKVIPNRDEPSSTHIFLDMGGGNLLAFFDFPKHGSSKTRRGTGSMHHIALKGTTEQYFDVVKNVQRLRIAHDIHGDETGGSIYMRDPDDILVEVTTGY